MTARSTPGGEADRAKQLGFNPQACVRWLEPGELVRTAVKAGLASIFANYGDKREVQAVFGEDVLQLVDPPSGDLWLDYAADIGDGFNATYTVASLLAQSELTLDATVLTASDGKLPVADDGGGAQRLLRLPRGNVLVLGGDEVYPSASARAYEDRTTGPYAAAFPADSLGAEDGPNQTLLAIPGNHDWYDGLSAFLRIFTRNRKIGAWTTVQTRSYFALQPSPGWWIVGLDSQLGEYIDQPQLDYFRDQLTSKLRPGDGIIFCAAEPTWVYTATRDPDEFNQLHYFLKHYIRNRVDPQTGELVPTGAEVRLWLSGDSHHYCRYQQEVKHDGDDHDGPQEVRRESDSPETSRADPRAVQLITCGLGGAYLADTHRLPDQLILPPPRSRMQSSGLPASVFVRAAAAYPEPAASRRMSRRVINPFSRHWIAWRNPGFAVALGFIHLAVFMAVVWFLNPGPALTPEAVGTGRSLQVQPTLWFCAVAGSILAVVVAAGWIAAACRGSNLIQRRAPVLVGLGLELMVTLLLVLAATIIPWPQHWPSWAIHGCTWLMAWLGGAALGCEAFGVFTLTAVTPQIADWQMSSQAIEDHKGFLRMCIRDDGTLEVYPLVIDSVVRKWEYASTASGGTRPVARTGLPTPRLLEPPIVISRTGFSAG
ncbi:metallophosphoesterase [Paenarthrobacter sp. Z7-10]|uniref:metallophosphoesterase n=1 Tax=Paenarthrobacter sp. Z7-10 TaxID=2787635 RepID=UPI0022A997C7|nr:metallophosphoesterase [Paenarthrobacter sp. Z7-10]MCZ2402205.1 metallophosphoesterase [Paenarthrobacter sp. Z7-10]